MSTCGKRKGRCGDQISRSRQGLHRSARPGRSGAARRVDTLGWLPSSTHPANLRRALPCATHLWRPVSLWPPMPAGAEEWGPAAAESARHMPAHAARTAWTASAPGHAAARATPRRRPRPTQRPSQKLPQKYAAQRRRSAMAARRLPRRARTVADDDDRGLLGAALWQVEPRLAALAGALEAHVRARVPAPRAANARAGTAGDGAGGCGALRCERTATTAGSMTTAARLHTRPACCPWDSSTHNHGDTVPRTMARRGRLCLGCVGLSSRAAQGSCLAPASPAILQPQPPLWVW